MIAAGVQVRSAAPRTRRAALPVAGRLLRLELRRNAMPWMVPLIAVLFWFDCYRVAAAAPPLWIQRTFDSFGQGHALIDFGPFVAGVAAWMGSRDSRHGLSDLATAMARPRWAAQLASWAATACWAVGGYLVFVGVLFAVYAGQGVWGGPPWWPVAVGAAGVAAFSALGFALGAYFPSRFAAPLAAFGAFMALVTSSQTGFSHPSGWALILPTNSNGNYGADSGIFYPYLPDLPIARVMFLAGLAVAALGLLGWPAAAGGLRLRRLAGAVTVTGMLAAGTAVGLATTARPSAHGLAIPALHNAATDQPIRYAPVCVRAMVPVCLHPAYRSYLTDVTAALGPVLREVTGLRGRPGRVVQVAANYASPQNVQMLGPGRGETISGSPPVLRLSLGGLALPGAFGSAKTDFIDQLRLLFAHVFVNAGRGGGTRAQQAVQAALLQGAGLPFAAQPGVLAFDGLPLSGPTSPAGGATGSDGGAAPGPATGPVYAAAGRFAALPAAVRHAWLAAHLGALRAGRLSLAALP
jgi:hypothetical protein